MMPCRINSLQITRPPNSLPSNLPNQPPTGPNNAVPAAPSIVVAPAALAAFTGSFPVSRFKPKLTAPAPAFDIQFALPAPSKLNSSPLVGGV